jgi:hypothetical protein
MEPRPTTPVNSPRGSICARVTTTCPPVQKHSTPPPCISVGVSPIRVQRTPTRTFASRGVSPQAPALIETIPPSLAAWLQSISQMDTVAPWDSARTPTRARSPCLDMDTHPTHPTRPPIRTTSPISITESDSEADGVQKRSRIRPRSQEIVPETQGDDGIPVCSHFLISRIYLLIQFIIQFLQSYYTSNIKQERPSESKRRRIYKS